MGNFELRALRLDGSAYEEGRCLGCRQELENPVNVPRGMDPDPSLLFPDVPTDHGVLQGLCLSCLVGMQRAVLLQGNELLQAEYLSGRNQGVES